MNVDYISDKIDNYFCMNFDILVIHCKSVLLFWHKLINILIVTLLRYRGDFYVMLAK